jgi:hypothetical protein
MTQNMVQEEPAAVATMTPKNQSLDSMTWPNSSTTLSLMVQDEAMPNLGGAEEEVPAKHRATAGDFLRKWLQLREWSQFWCSPPQVWP